MGETANAGARSGATESEGHSVVKLKVGETLCNSAAPFRGDIL
jgi:hypothetical protein